MVQKGDVRQYISNGVAEKNQLGAYAGLVNQAMGATQSIAQQANQADIASKQIDLMSEWYKKNNEINTKYQADPTNPQRETDLKEAFETLSEQYQVNPFVQSQWNEVKRAVFDKTKMYNAQWQENQLKTNAQNNLKNGYEQLVNQVSMLGLNGAGIDDIRLTYSNGVDALRKGATSVLGDVVAENFLHDSTHDMMTTYISALAQNNPLKAQELLKDEGVRNDIGRAETLEKLDGYVASSLANQNKKTAINELGNVLRSMNSEEADEIINGKADLNKVMKFVENNKGLPDGSKEMILSIYGINSTKNDYVYDVNKKKIVKRESLSGGSGGKAIGKMTALEKRLCAENLEQDLHNLLSFDDMGELDVKNVQKNKTQQQASEQLIGYMKNVARLQERIDTAYNSQAIDKSTRQRMMNDYIAPVTDYIQSKVEQFDEKSLGIAGQKLGYGRINKMFNTDGLKGNELRDMQRQKLFAQNYYLDELNKAVQEAGMKSIYDIEDLKPHLQKEIYQRASENAIKRAERWTDKPELFFAKEFPDIYLQPSKYFKANEAKAINHIVAEATFKRKFENPDGSSKIDLKSYADMKCKEEMRKQYKANQIKAGNTLGLIKDANYSMSNPLPKNYGELVKELNGMGYTIKDFQEFTAEKGYVKNGYDLWKGYMSDAHMKALLDLRQVRAMKGRK